MKESVGRGRVLECGGNDFAFVFVADNFVENVGRQCVDEGPDLVGEGFYEGFYHFSKRKILIIIKIDKNA